METPLRRFSGQKLRKARENAQFSRFKLGMAMSPTMTPGTIYNYEVKGRCPRLDTALEMAKILGVKPGDLTE